MESAMPAYLRRGHSNRVHPAAAGEEVATEAAAPLLAHDYAATAAATPVAKGSPASPGSFGVAEEEATTEAFAPAGAEGMFSLLARLTAALVAAWHSLLSALSSCLAALLRPLQRAQRRRIAPLQLSPLQQARLEALQQRAAVPYDPQSEAHVAALRTLWEAGFPEQPFPPGVKSPQWKEMGWQGEDPATDFRGAGFLSLEALLHLALHQPQHFLGLMHKRQGARSEWEYPFAAGGVNLTYMLVELLDLRRSPGAQPATQAGAAFLEHLVPASAHAFEEVFALSYRLLDRLWLERGATYMEFPAVMAEVRQRLCVALGGGSSLTFAALEAALLGSVGGEQEKA